MAENNKSTRKSKASASIEDLNSNYGRIQPQAREFEESVLGAILLERDAYSIVSDILKKEAFYEKRHEHIYEAITDLASQQSPIDMLTVTEQLRRNERLEEVGGAAYIAELASRIGSGAHVEFHARIIAQKALARELISFSTEVQTKAFDDLTDVDELMQEAEGRLFEISKTSVKRDFVHVGNVVADAIHHIEIAATRTDGMSGLPSGFNLLDKITSGWQNSDLVIFAARPAMGKTAFVLSMAKNMAVDYQTPVAVFSLEMSNLQLVNRIISNVCQLESNKIRNGRLEPYEWQQLNARVRLLENAPIFVDDTAALSIFELRTKARRLVREHGVKCIIIDYLQLMNASGMKFGSREQEVSLISRSLKGLAKELNIPIIALSQLNRSVESRENKEGKRPQLSDLRESGAIEQDADMVCFIHRPEYYKLFEDPMTGESLKGVAEIIVAKHRNGAVGDVRLRFRGEFARFENLDQGGDSAAHEYVSQAVGGADYSVPPPMTAPTHDDVPPF